LLERTGAALAASSLGGFVPGASAPAAVRGGTAITSWRAVRNQFELDPDLIHLGGFLLASHPKIVRDRIETHRRGLDANPVEYLHGQGPGLEQGVLAAAAAYLGPGLDQNDIALTDSTTMGLGLLYNGIKLTAGQEALTSNQDFFATTEALRYKKAQTGATVRQIDLYQDIGNVSADEIVAAVAGNLKPATRLVAMTWVHSSTGLKIPVARIAAVIAQANQGRDPADRILFSLDGVHGFAVEDVTMSDLGCDFFVSGCHKWLCGPRGTGLVWGKPAAWRRVTPTIPSFSGSWGYDPPGPVNTPGGFHSFEHRWALAQAFQFQTSIGRSNVSARIRALNRRLKTGLAELPKVTLITPLDTALSAGIVCFDVSGYTPEVVVQRLRENQIVGTVTPSTKDHHVRLAATLFNFPEEVDAAVTVIGSL